MDYAHYEIYKQSQAQVAERAERARIATGFRASKRRWFRIRIRSPFVRHVDGGEERVGAVA